MTESRRAPRDRRRAADRRNGYVVVAVIDSAMLWCAHHVLGWGWPPFLTPAFEDLLPLIDLSLGAAIALNVLWVGRDPAWFRHLGQVGLNVLSAAVSVRAWLLFPFDFSGYAFPWDTVARVTIVLSVVGLVLASVSEIVKLVQETRPQHARRALDGTR
jgi:hypothetical protein